MDEMSPPPSYTSRSTSLASPLPHQLSDSSFYIPSSDSDELEMDQERNERRSSILLPKHHSASLISSRRRLSTRTRIAVIISTTLGFIVFFRRHLIALALILNCYITWPFSPPPLLNIDIPSLPPLTPSAHPSFIPRNLHHVLLGPLGTNPPADWLAARNSCVTMHADWENHYFWTDDDADTFFEENYPWFLDTWSSYPTIVQRADALRYFVLHKFGGVFLDMDLFCRTPLDGLVSYLEAVTPRHPHRRPQGGMYILAESGHPHMLLAPKANPVGVSNGFIIASRGHPLLSQMITFLPRFNLNFILRYATVMFSTGCMYISSHMQLFTRRRWGKGTVFVLDGVENMLNGNVDTPLFRHLGTSSWHEGDAKFIRKIVGGVKRSPVGMGWIILFVVLFLGAIIVYRRRGGRTVRGGFRRLLRRVSLGDHEDDS
jgi:inositol phosphorylceramide mannosyltransferase catalytic subunit